MSFKEIKELRQAGRLDEALQMANQALESEPGNIWNKRAAGWVYYDYLKKNSQPESYDLFKENLIKIKELNFPEGEKMVFDKCAWQIGVLVFALQNEVPIDYDKINELFELIKDFHFTKPSEAYSYLFKAFHKIYKTWTNYLTFADWWNFENLRPEDYLKEEFKGRKHSSIAEQAHNAYSKKLLEGESLDSYSKKRVVDKDRIVAFLPKLNSLIEKHPEYLYPMYFKAKLLLELGSDDNVFSAFLPFAKQKKNDFWVWSLMAEIFSEDKDIQFACYCKALSLRVPEDFLVKVRQTFVELLVEKKMFDEAKTEILQIIAIRDKNEWKLPYQLLEWTKQDWFSSATEQKDNQELYKRNLRKAEEILYMEIPEEIVVVEFVNANKSILHFVKDKHKFGFLKYNDHLTTPKIGDIFKVRFDGEGQDNYYKILTAKKESSNSTTEVIKDFTGTLRVISPKKIGFVDDIFFDTKIIREKELTNGLHIQGRAMLSFDKKKNKWGWKVIEIKKPK